MPNLSTLVGGRVPDYIEYAWITTHTGAPQSFNQNTLWFTLSVTTEKHDTGNLVSAPVNNQFVLPAGTYYYEAFTKYRINGAINGVTKIGLYNITDSVWVTQSAEQSEGAANYTSTTTLKGQFKITSSKTFELKGRILTPGNASVAVLFDSGLDNTQFPTSSQFTNSDEDQRTTIKLWKLS